MHKIQSPCCLVGFAGVLKPRDNLSLHCVKLMSEHCMCTVTHENSVCSPRPLKWILVMCKVNVSPLGTKTLHDPKITKNPQKLYWNQALNDRDYPRMCTGNDANCTSVKVQNRDR